MMRFTMAAALLLISIGVSNARDLIHCEDVRCVETRHTEVPATSGGGRPHGCPHAWCGCWLGIKLGLTDRSLWLARNWARVGRGISHPQEGAIVVMSRGSKGGHVGIIQDVADNGDLVVLSGNHNNRVGVGTYPRKRVIAYRLI